MKLQVPWQRGSVEKKEPPSKELQIDVSMPRECVFKRFEKEPGPCPRCGESLQQSRQSYLVATWRGKERADSFIMGSDFGWFCAQCPTVVIDPREVSGMLQHAMPRWNASIRSTVAGIVDLGAIPEEKSHLPFNEDDNPIPLVEFSTISQEAEEDRLELPLGTHVRQHAAPERENGGFEERYEDILQNIEFGIVQVYRNHPEMTDWQALDAIEALLRKYRAEVKGRQTSRPSLDLLAGQTYDLVETMCEWRLGREVSFTDKEGEPLDLSPEPVTLDEIVACLKRVRKSINRWRRIGGRQGYLTFVEQYIA